MSMDYSKFTDKELVNFISNNLSLFEIESSEIDLIKLSNGLEIDELSIVKRHYGFAVTYRGSNKNNYTIPAELLFLFVSEKYRNNGYGKELIRTVINTVIENTPIILFCKGKIRKTYFESYGFIAREEDNPFLGFVEEYEMRYEKI